MQRGRVLRSVLMNLLDRLKHLCAPPCGNGSTDQVVLIVPLAKFVVSAQVNGFHLVGNSQRWIQRAHELTTIKVTVMKVLTES